MWDALDRIGIQKVSVADPEPQGAETLVAEAGAGMKFRAPAPGQNKVDIKT
jgi:hypothetical protein